MCIEKHNWDNQLSEKFIWRLAILIILIVLFLIESIVLPVLMIL